jgi:cation diffusion facilitator family transporter
LNLKINQGVEILHTKSIEHWIHDHTFGQDNPKAGEHRTILTIIISAITMVVEIIAGIFFGSMALLADGLHMGSHTVALAISAFAYYYTRRHAKDTRFNFGTGKVNSLAAFASAMILLLFTFFMAWESILRFIKPKVIEFNQAIFVAVLGLIVNGICIFILKGDDHHHSHEGEQHSHQDHQHNHENEDHHHNHTNHDLKEDQNLWSAYMHVMADALTSVLAIFALLSGKYFGLTWFDPLMGIVGAILILRWSIGLIRSSSHVLLDMKGSESVASKIRKSIESHGDDRISDLHLWSVGPGIFATEIAVVTSNPKSPDFYIDLIPHDLGLVHVTVEVHLCNECAEHLVTQN